MQDVKAQVRREALERRGALSAGRRARASAAICGHLLGLSAVRSARTLLGFAAFGSEVDLDPFLSERIDHHIGVFLPYVTQLSPPRLEMARVRDLERDLAPGRFGVREPDPDGRRPARADRLDAVVVPGVAFDADGGRLGYGRGFYDRFLSRLRPGTLVIGVAFATQVVDAVPREAHDLPVDAVVTERGVVSARPSTVAP